MAERVAGESATRWDSHSSAAPNSPNPLACTNDRVRAGQGVIRRPRLWSIFAEQANDWRASIIVLSPVGAFVAVGWLSQGDTDGPSVVVGPIHLGQRLAKRKSPKTTHFGVGKPQVERSVAESFWAMGGGLSEMAA